MPSRAVAAVLAAMATISDASRTNLQSMQAYEEFRRKFGVERTHADSESYMARVLLFEKRREEVHAHNAKPGKIWVAEVNQFADYTRDEFQAMLGHRPLGRTSSSEPKVSSFLQMKPSAPLAASVDWSVKLNNSKVADAKSQGGCGSCWAVASAGALETHAAKLGGSSIPEVSYEQLVDCTPNPEECGGQGGCNGATAELAFQYVQEHGLVAKADYKGYQSGGDGTCHQPSSTPILTTSGFVRLPVNKLQPLMEALATQGPAVVSADASFWSAYSKGVFNDCEKDAVINHAILCMGYGKDAELDKSYWLIRNSWGSRWGERGYIRLLRHTEEDAYCGTDNRPLEGVGCKGGLATLPVCGMCGILSDSAHPTGVKLASQ